MSASVIISPDTIGNISVEVGNALVTMNKVGAVCILPEELNKFTYVIGFFGFVLGIAATLAFQWLRKKGREKGKQIREEREQFDREHQQ